jgi:hypothetical protein
MKTVEARLIKFTIPSVVNEKGKVKNLKFFQIQTLETNIRHWPIFPISKSSLTESWNYLYDENSDFNSLPKVSYLPKVVPNKKEAIDCIRKHSGVRDEELTILLHPTLLKL